MPKFKKGQSGNPGGRPKQSAELVKLAREYTDDALNRVVEIMEDPDAPRTAQLKAAEIILDRGWGKAPQTVDLRTNPLENLGADEQRVILQALEIIEQDEASAADADTSVSH